jgi:hypothetical protein
MGKVAGFWVVNYYCGGCVDSVVTKSEKGFGPDRLGGYRRLGGDGSEAIGGCLPVRSDASTCLCEMGGKTWENVGKRGKMRDERKSIQFSVCSGMAQKWCGTGEMGGLGKCQV